LRKSWTPDIEEFERLVRDNERRILTIAYQICGNLEDARDIAQDTFLRAFRSRHRLWRDRSAGPWLNRIAVNSAIDFLNRRKGTETLPLEGLERSPAGSSGLPRESSLEDRLQAKQDTRELFRLLGRLAPRERAAFVLRHLQGLTTEETARSMGCTRITVRRHASRAREKLRLALQERAGADRGAVSGTGAGSGTPDPRVAGSWAQKKPAGG
jgi:RNA polymerase sigma-70 factor (ECF subfamily)